MTLTGAELATARLALAAKPEMHLQPEPGARLDPKRNYRVAVTARQISPLVGATHLAPRQYTLTELELASALGRSGFRRTVSSSDGLKTAQLYRPGRGSTGSVCSLPGVSSNPTHFRLLCESFARPTVGRDGVPLRFARDPPGSGAGVPDGEAAPLTGPAPRERLRCANRGAIRGPMPP